MNTRPIRGSGSVLRVQQVNPPWTKFPRRMARSQMAPDRPTCASPYSKARRAARKVTEFAARAYWHLRDSITTDHPALGRIRPTHPPACTCRTLVAVRTSTRTARGAATTKSDARTLANAPQEPVRSEPKVGITIHQPTGGRSPLEAAMRYKAGGAVGRSRHEYGQGSRGCAAKSRSSSRQAGSCAIRAHPPCQLVFMVVLRSISWRARARRR